MINGTIIYTNKVTYTMKLTDSFSIDCIGTPPNRFHRFMMRVVFGFSFKIVPALSHLGEGV